MCVYWVGVWKSEFLEVISPFTMWVLRIELRFSNLATNALTH